MHCDGIISIDLELQRKKDGKWCILTFFGTIWNCREKWKRCL